MTNRNDIQNSMNITDFVAREASAVSAWAVLSVTTLSVFADQRTAPLLGRAGRLAPGRYLLALAR
jgi:hypothetical protein